VRPLEIDLECSTRRRRCREPDQRHLEHGIPGTTEPIDKGRGVRVRRSARVRVQRLDRAKGKGRDAEYRRRVREMSRKRRQHGAREECKRGPGCREVARREEVAPDGAHDGRAGGSGGRLQHHELCARREMEACPRLAATRQDDGAGERGCGREREHHQSRFSGQRANVHE